MNPETQTTAEKVEKARVYADAGSHEEAAALLYDLAVEDRAGDIGYAERMRWYEVVGVLERAGFDLRTCFMTKGC